MREEPLAGHATPSAPGTTGVRVAATAEVPDSTTDAARAMATLRRLGATVAEIGTTLGGEDDALWRGEALDVIERRYRCSVPQMLTLSVARVEAWFATLGSDLTLDLALAGLDPDAEAVAATLRSDRGPGQALRSFATAARAIYETQGDDVVAEVRLRVAKVQALAAAEALRSCAGEAPHHHPSAPEQRAANTPPPGTDALAVFYCTAACARFLSATNIAALEEVGLLSDDGRAFIVVCDAPGYLAGPALEVVGADGREPRWLPMTQAARRRFAARAAAQRQMLAEEVNWQAAPDILTPAHLRVEVRSAGLEEVARPLAWLRAEVAAAYLASAAHGEWQSTVTVRFAGPRPAFCTLGAANMETDGPDAPSALARLAEWAYASAAPETLAIARECLARELPSGVSVSLADVERLASPALEAAKANFALYVRGKTQQYFALRQSAQEAVATYAESVRKAVSDLTGDVVENVYRTAGVIVGVVIAGLIQPSASPVVARLGAALLACYVAFILSFVLRARWDHFLLEADGLRMRLAGMPELTEAERERLRQPASAADTHFQRYFQQTRLIYLALLATCLLVFLITFTPVASHLGMPPGSATAIPTHTPAGR